MHNIYFISSAKFQRDMLELAFKDFKENIYTADNCEGIDYFIEDLLIDTLVIDININLDNISQIISSYKDKLSIVLIGSDEALLNYSIQTMPKISLPIGPSDFIERLKEVLK